MLLDFLNTKYRRRIEEAWGAFEIGAYATAREHFTDVLAEAQHDGAHTVFDIAEAHAGLGAIALRACDIPEAHRWYGEARYELSRHYADGFPKRLRWHSYHDRCVMRTLIGLAHCAYARGKTDEALDLYRMLQQADTDDRLGTAEFLEALTNGRPFPHNSCPV